MVRKSARILGVLLVGSLLVGVGAARAGGNLDAALYAPGETGSMLVPAGTSLDCVEQVDGVLEVYLTVPDVAADWRLSDLDMQRLEELLLSGMGPVAAPRGLRVAVRVAGEEAYGSLERFWAGQRAAAREPVPGPAEVPVPLTTLPTDGAGRPAGPVTQAGRQPVGALTGVTVFVSAGHGWTADNVFNGDSTDGKWYLQRPVLLNMAEDYGNVDQLNYFVHYAYNAGATVVPFRPVGWQDIEIVIDQDDPQVTYAGAWSDGSYPKYYENNVTNSGVPYRYATADTVETATARYTPNITITDFYPVYCFTIAGANRTLQTYRIRHSGGTSEVVIDHRLVGNGWIWLGEYFLEAGGDNWVEISNRSADAGVVVADAIRWGNGIGDVVRPGPGTVSGFPRDEEAQRYWAESELGNNAAGFDLDIWDPQDLDDGSDNVRVGAKWGREMNQEPGGGVLVDRWKRIHLEFHTNASGGTARGCIALITTLGETTYQPEYAQIMADEVDADMAIMDDQFEHTWYDRVDATYTSAYGAICTEANSDEFDATIIELAFHDNQQDTELLRDPRVRSAMARSCLQGMIRFLSTVIPGSPVPLAFAPDTPRNVRAADLGTGDVALSWDAPLSDGARGDPATGYVVYSSANGYGFGSPVVLGNVLTTTISGLAQGEVRYFRIAATNAGGESMPSEVLAVRRPPTANDKKVMIVNGFDRLRRSQNPIQNFTQPPDYAGKWIERQIWRQSNAYDYVIEHAEALAASTVGFVTCANEAVSSGQVALNGYDIVVWIAGEENSEDATLDTTEQSKLTSFLESGGGLFISGAELGYDLDSLNHGRTFYEGKLKCNYVANDAGTYTVTGAAGSIFNDIGAIDFSVAAGAPYDVDQPDQIAPQTAGVAALTYVGGTGGTAAVQYDQYSVFRAVTFAFPFEAVPVAATRTALMQRIVDFLSGAVGATPFDRDLDGDVDMADFYPWFTFCLQGPKVTYNAGHSCLREDGNGDFHVDLADFALFQEYFTGPHP